MYPYLHFGALTLGTFGLLLWLGCVAGTVVLDRNFKRNVISADAVVVVATAVIAGIVGAKLWHVLQDVPLLRREMAEIFSPGSTWQITLRFFHWFSAGFAWFGGLVAGVVALVLQARSAGLTGLRMLDLAAPAAAVGYGVGRIGCLTSGDGDTGIATTHWWGVHIRNDALAPPMPNPPGHLVEPTPVYECVFGMLLGLYLWQRGRVGSRAALSTGQITGEYLVLSGIGRFLIEFIRVNPRVYGPFTNAQVASLLTMVAGVALIVYARGGAQEPVGVPEQV